MKLFQPDNFSRSDIFYREINNDSLFITIFGKYFKNSEILDIAQLNRSEVNSENFRVHAKVDGENKYFLLRRHKVLTNKKQIDFYIELLLQLEKQQVPVSAVIKSLDDTYSVSVENELYSLFDFIEARYFVPSEMALRSVALSIAKMHFALNKLDQSSADQIKEYSKLSKVYYNVVPEYSEADFSQIIDLIIKQESITEVEQELVDYWEVIKKLIAEVKNNQTAIDKLPQQIIHSDLHPHNILINDNTVRAIVDFDSVRLSQQARDVAFAIYRFGRQFFVSNKTLEKKDGVWLNKLFLDSYCQIMPLDKTAIDLLPIIIKDEFLRKILFVMRGVYLDNNIDWKGDLAKFITAFQEFKYFWP